MPDAASKAAVFGHLRRPLLRGADGGANVLTLYSMQSSGNSDKVRMLLTRAVAEQIFLPLGLLAIAALFILALRRVHLDRGSAPVR